MLHGKVFGLAEYAAVEFSHLYLWIDSWYLVHCAALTVRQYTSQIHSAVSVELNFMWVRVNWVNRSKFRLGSWLTWVQGTMAAQWDESIRSHEGWQVGDVSFCQITLDTGWTGLVFSVISLNALDSGALYLPDYNPTIPHGICLNFPVG